MENLPPVILVDILSRLRDSTDLARCRLVSRNMRFLAGEVHSLSMFCSRKRFFKYRSRRSRERIIPFRSMLIKLIGKWRSPLSLSLRRARTVVRSLIFDDTGVDDADNLHLTDADFLSKWLPSIALRLTSLSIGDFSNHAFSDDAVNGAASYLGKLEMESRWRRSLLEYLSLNFSFIRSLSALYFVSKAMTRTLQC